MRPYGLALIAILGTPLISASLLVGSAAAQGETRGDSWNSINTTLGTVEKLTGKNETATVNALQQLQAAKAQYDEIFGHVAKDLDQPTAQLVQDAFAELKAGVESGNVLAVTLSKQVVDKTMYKIAFMKIEEELLENEVEDAAEWFTVMSKKFGYDQNPSNASNAMRELEANPAQIGELAPVILGDLRSTFLLKVKEEIAEALEAQSKQPPDNASAQKFAVEAISYYRTIQPDVKQKLGDELEALLFHELDEFSESAQAGNITKMNGEAEEINGLLLDFEGKETSGIGVTIGGIIDSLRLVNAEYIDAVKDGEIIDQEEYYETLLFIKRATDKFTAAKEELSDIATEETLEVEQDLAAIAEMVNNKEDAKAVSDRVLHAQAELNAILQASGGGSGSIDGWGYIARINSILDKSVAEYREGSYDEARELAREAYLDNYEHIEKDIAEDDRTLMEKIEIDMREELVQMIDQRRPVTEIESHVQVIKTDLETAKAVVTPEFSFATIVAIVSLAGAMITGTLYAQRKGFSFPPF